MLRSCRRSAGLSVRKPCRRHAPRLLSKSSTGAWGIPHLLTQPVTDRERGAIVALSMDGMGPKKIAAAFDKADRVADVVGAYTHKSAGALAALERLGARAVLPCDDEYPDLL